jgi:hypothetical protein
MDSMPRTPTEGLISANINIKKMIKYHPINLNLKL